VKVTVVGLGKIGLPLAVQYAGGGHEVLGVDTDPRVVDQVNAGRVPFPGEAHLPERLAVAVGSGALVACGDSVSAVSRSDVVVVVVPLYVDDEARPDFSAIDAATTAVGRGLCAGTLVVYETTLPVGTTRSRLAPAIAAASGINVDDLLLAFSPERVYSGRVFADLRRYPKLVGGLSDESARRAVAFYSQALVFDERPDLARENGVWDLGSVEAAELAKLAETTYRDVNIGLANQFARYADHLGVDVFRVIEACNSQPFSHIHRPGIAVGGHCIPVYPRLYLWNDPDATIVRAAREANSAMPAWAVDVLAREHGDLAGEHVLVLGAAYRGGVKETAFSGVFGLVDALRARGAVVSVHDPLFDDAELAALGLVHHVPGEVTDAAIVQADHDEYGTLGSEDLPTVRTVVDGRHVLDWNRWSGVRIAVLGRSAAELPVRIGAT